MTTLLIRLYEVVGNLTAWGITDREVLYQLEPVRRYRMEHTVRLRTLRPWMNSLHWWARWRWEELTGADWTG